MSNTRILDDCRGHVHQVSHASASAAAAERFAPEWRTEDVDEQLHVPVVLPELRGANLILFKPHKPPRRLPLLAWLFNNGVPDPLTIEGPPGDNDEWCIETEFGDEKAFLFPWGDRFATFAAAQRQAETNLKQYEERRARRVALAEETRGCRQPSPTATSAGRAQASARYGSSAAVPRSEARRD